MTNAKSVFISYSSQDHEFVERIVDMLQEEGITYWKAPEMIPAGSSYAKEIPRAIKNCQIFLLMLSKTSQKSIWVEKETDSAISHRKYIIPFQIDDMPLNDTFRFYLNNVQMIAYSSDAQESMKDLKNYLKLVLSKGLYKSEEEVATDTKSTVSVEVTRKNGKTTEKKTVEKVVATKKEEPKSQTLKRGYVNKTDSNALRINRIPLECDYCGCKLLKNVTMGTYRCTKCGEDSYDDYQTIRNYLDQVGTATAPVIERNTGVPKRVIEYFFREEFLEIPKNSPIRVRCESCGAPIRTGSLCDMCKNSGKKITTKDRRGTWHSLY